MKRRRVGPDRSGLAVLLRLFFSSLLRSTSYLPSISREVSVQYHHGAKCTDTGYMFSDYLFSFWLLLDYLRQTTLLRSSSPVSPGKD